MQAEPAKVWASKAAVFSAALLDAEKAAPDFLTSTTGGNDPRRFAVYKNNVTVGLIRAMESNFPAIQKLVGEEYFTALARLFVEKYPPTSRILAQYGADFAQFLDAFEPLDAYPYLGDVARLERFWREAFHEADADPVTSEQLASVKPQEIAMLRFEAHPATRLLRSNYAAGSIFTANRSDDEYKKFDPAMAEFVLITRPYFECALRILNEADGAFISSLIAGQTLHEAVDQAVATKAPFDLASSISGVLEAGAFCSFNNQE